MFCDKEYEFSSYHFPTSKKFNLLINNSFSELVTTNNVKRTHLFNNRYENIYVERSLIPSILPVLNFANECAKKTLEIESNRDIGFWFNDMPPGSTTLPHTHDDDDELLSGVYYIKVPENSGNLILTKNNNKKIIEAKEGNLILFKPTCLHEVSENKSEEQRLSIGINFGLKKS